MAVFGSARIREDDPAYASARAIGGEFARRGWAVITGGGPGVMEAANRGAQEAGGLSVGLGIELPHEQGINPYVDLSYTFEHFYARKVCFVKPSEGFVVLPGGFGTLDETFEALTLIQTGQGGDLPRRPLRLDLLGRPARLDPGHARRRRHDRGPRPRPPASDRRPRHRRPDRDRRLRVKS